ncbi:TIGR03084 family protein [Amycolatopsis xylanica]|uniref:TIGR03084 family protein n=1 Tax=Amycolatopsis xylanica TaxID=589385 RepID=A0A1H3SE89_9PSEU|nr:TIGR03084 family metal-binding protein [Amycolatopsis xylanica]SDZ35871.1 TIGR03084 family protein [Amycolatopsis xylanica]
MVDIDAIVDDLDAERADLDEAVAGLDSRGWRSPTPAEGLTIACQIAHLNWTDELVLRAIASPAEFAGGTEGVLAPPDATDAINAGAEFVNAGTRQRSEWPKDKLLAAWRDSAAELSRTLRALPRGTRIPWFAPRPLSAAAMASSRLMEIWAHGQDVFDALSLTREPTRRLMHVARLGVRSRDFAYQLRGMVPPEREFRVELRAPGGEVWCWGPEDAAERVEGSALDFALVATQRLHRHDSDLVARGEAPEAWLAIAQAYAGPVGSGRPRLGPPEGLPGGG